MGQIIQVNGEYFVEFYGNGLRFRKKAGDSLAEAEAKLAQIESSLSRTAPEVPPGTATCAMFRERFAAYADQAYPARTAQRLKAAAAHAGDFLSHTLEEPAYLRAVTPRVLEDYRQNLISEMPGHPVLTNFTLYLLREVFQYAVGLGWLNDNPLVHTRWVPEPVRRAPAVYAEGELIQLREGLSADEDRFLAMQLYAGLTPAEVCGLCWTDVDFGQRELEVRAGSGADITVRRVPLDFRLYDMLREWHGVAGDAQKVFSAAPHPGRINPYRLRNTFVRDVLARGVTLTRLNRLLGIDDVAKVFRYRVFLPASGETGGMGPGDA